MENWKLEVWKDGKLGHQYPKGSQKALLADIIISCVIEAQAFDITPEEVFCKRRWPLATAFRGIMIVSISDVLRLLGYKATEEKASAIFGLTRCAVYHATRNYEGSSRISYENILNGPLGFTIKTRMKEFLAMENSRRRTRNRAVQKKEFLV